MISEKQCRQVQFRQVILVVILNNQMQGYREGLDQISTIIEKRRKKGAKKIQPEPHFPV